MNEKVERFIDKKGIRKWFKRDNLIILILSGVLLLIIALPTKSGSSSGNGTQKQPTPQTTQNGTQKTDQGSQQTEGDYASSLEQKLEKILGGMSGVGRVRVMITLSSSEELVVEKDIPSTRSNTTENDSEGGSRSIVQSEVKEDTVYRTEGSDSEPYVVKTLFPRVEGVVVVAEGAGGETAKNITEIVQALFGVEAHKVKVVKMSKTG